MDKTMTIRCDDCGEDVVEGLGMFRCDCGREFCEYCTPSTCEGCGQKLCNECLDEDWRGTGNSYCHGCIENGTAESNLLTELRRSDDSGVQALLEMYEALKENSKAEISILKNDLADLKNSMQKLDEEIKAAEAVDEPPAYRYAGITGKVKGWLMFRLAMLR